MERLPSMGRYDLSIRNTTYDRYKEVGNGLVDNKNTHRDNGSFKCMLKEGGTGRTLYSKTVSTTVLLTIIIIMNNIITIRTML